jgi:hypothetical protein
LGAYTKADDEAMTIAFGARGKKRLNRVFDVIGFVYPDYCFLLENKEGREKLPLRPLPVHRSQRELRS